VLTLTLRDSLDLGGAFLQWEVATAIAGSILGIDAFDQPKVQESKDNTKRVLATFTSTGNLPAAEAVPAHQAVQGITDLLSRAKPDANLALMAYTAHTPISERALERLRVAMRDRRRIATTAGYGPRFLHSTGQLHKGGPPVGLFLQIVQDDTLRCGHSGPAIWLRDPQTGSGAGRSGIPEVAATTRRTREPWPRAGGRSASTGVGLPCQGGRAAISFRRPRPRRGPDARLQQVGDRCPDRRGPGLPRAGPWWR